MAGKIRVGIVGYGTIGKRVADAVRLQDDMELVGVTVHSYNYRMIACQEKGIAMYTWPESEELNGLNIAGTFEDLLKKVDVIVDCSPKKGGAENKEKYYIPNKIKAIFQGGEKPKVADASFNAQSNYDACVGKNYLRVVSCNTTGLCRTLNAIRSKYGIEAVHATMIRRGADPWDIRHGPINAIVPVLELPSHHGPDVRTVLPDVEIFTTAISVSTTLMHLHTITVDCKETPNVDEVIKLFKNTTRIRVVANESAVRSTAEIMEFAKDLGRDRADMPEIVVWKEAIGTYKNKLLYMQAIHQESDVVCENIDAIRAVMGFKDGKASIAKTNKALRIDIGKHSAE
ncbi:MAG TPA: type II glyceraldehyde-3-phosphate dehydrogenase [Candidatus Nanoarchaeia archaeon]|nr:type II glyceraldehyde-3-phosphate dehydrogenase [Candidatus Nanoarchaeia archaeon]